MRHYRGMGYKQNNVAQAWSADIRFCVIGAGAAGLTVAAALRERGYRDITVFEREPVVGGKCYTHATDDGFLELGANIVFPGSVVHRLAERTGASIIDWFPIQIFDLRTGDTRPFGSTERHFPLFQHVRAYGRLVAEVLRHRRLRRCGFHACTDADLMDLGTPVRSWLAARGLAVIEDAVMPFMVGAGLGYPEDEVPTAYFLKMLHFIQSMGISDLLRRRTYRFEHGYQDLWQRVAAQLLPDAKLLLGDEVQRVERSAGEPVRVCTRRGEIECDVLIVTAPERALAFLDASDAERDLLSRFRSFDMVTTGCTVHGRLPLGLCFIGPYTRSKSTLGHAFAYVPMKASCGSDVGEFVFYSHGSASVDARVIQEKLRQDLALQRCQIVGEPITKQWSRYFPHVSSADFRGGFFRRLDKLQGQRATYYFGEAISGTSVSVVADHAQAQVARFFPDLRHAHQGSMYGSS